MFLFGRNLPDGHSGPLAKLRGIKLKSQGCIRVFLLEMDFELYVGVDFHEGNIHINGL